MRELPLSLSKTEDFNYADDSALLKVFGTSKWTADHFSRQSEDRHKALLEVNEDLERLQQFGAKWKIAFEPTKTHAMLVSNTRDCGCFPAMSRLVFGGAHVIFEEQLLLVGFLFDKKLTWGPMVDRVASKSRRALGAVRRMQKLLGSSDRAVLYKAFVRSILEYGLLEYIAAAPSHLSKLDRIQSNAERLCGIQFTPLSERRDAAAFGLICKLLDGGCVDQLQQLCPTLTREKCGHGSRRSSSAFKLGNRERLRLDNSQRSFGGQMDSIFNKISKEILEEGFAKGWSAAMKPGQRFLGGSRKLDVGIKKDHYAVRRVIGVENSDAGRRYKVVWAGDENFGKDSWEKESNLVGAEEAVLEFWFALGEPYSADNVQLSH
jgi:hypothetical protein